MLGLDQILYGEMSSPHKTAMAFEQMLRYTGYDGRCKNGSLHHEHIV